MENEYLVHHGVKGMKWGVRRTPEQLGHPTAKKQYRTAMRNLGTAYITANKNVQNTRKDLLKLAKDSGMDRKQRRALKRDSYAKAAEIMGQNRVKYDIAGYEITKAYQRARVDELLRKYPEDSRKVRRAKKVAAGVVVQMGDDTVSKDPETGKYSIVHNVVYFY